MTKVEPRPAQAEGCFQSTRRSSPHRMAGAKNHRLGPDFIGWQWSWLLSRRPSPHCSSLPGPSGPTSQVRPPHSALHGASETGGKPGRGGACASLQNARMLRAQGKRAATGFGSARPPSAALPAALPGPGRTGGAARQDGERRGPGAEGGGWGRVGVGRFPQFIRLFLLLPLPRSNPARASSAINSSAPPRRGTE